MIYKIPVPNIDKIIHHVKNNFNTFYPWNDNEEGYSGYGLTYNPEYPLQKERQVLGPISEYFDLYQESHKFDKITCKDSEKLFELINLPYKPIRSRIAVIDGNSNINSRSAWHCDENPNYCIRVNIPIQTNEYYHLQTEIDLITPEIGYAYIWDTSKIHRAFCSKKNNLKRINLVLGYIPDEQDSYISEVINNIR